MGTVLFGQGQFGQGPVGTFLMGQKCPKRTDVVYYEKKTEEEL